MVACNCCKCLHFLALHHDGQSRCIDRDKEITLLSPYELRICRKHVYECSGWASLICLGCNSCDFVSWKMLLTILFCHADNEARTNENTRKPPTRGRTDHFSNILADREFSAVCYLFTVFNWVLLFSQSAVTGFSQLHFNFSINRRHP